MNAAKHIDTFELAALVGKIGGGPYRFREVIGHAGVTVTPEMYYHVVDVTDFNYPIELAANFQDAGSLQYLSTVGESGGQMLGDLGVILIDIPDTQRSHAGEAALTLMSGTVYNLANTSRGSALVLTRSPQTTRGVTSILPGGMVNTRRVSSTLTMRFSSSSTSPRS